MSNFKRGLSLTLSSVMLMGMMAVGTGAKTLDFTDANQIVNKDAVEVTSAIGIFNGYTDGTFRPNDVVTRGEMTVVIAKILYGTDVNVSSYAGRSAFSDVPSWMDGYVNLCYEMGIVSGEGDGTFAPNNTLTTGEAAIMMTKALGYFHVADEGAYAMGWEREAILRAEELSLFGYMELGARDNMTRDNVAEMALNALQNAPVKYNEIEDVYYNGSTWRDGILPVGDGVGYAESLLSLNFPDAMINNYLMVKSAEIKDETVIADVITANGDVYTTEIVSVDAEDDTDGIIRALNENNTIFAYEQVKSNSYSLKNVENSKSVGNQIVSGDKDYARDHFTEDTIFVDIATGASYVGYDAVPSYPKLTANYIAEQGDISVVFIQTEVSQYVLESHFFYVDNSTETFNAIENGDKYTGYSDVYMNGEKTEVHVADGTEPLKNNTLYTVGAINDAGVIQTVTELTSTSVVANVSEDKFWANRNSEQTKYTVTDTTIVTVVTQDHTDGGAVTVGIGDIDSFFVDNTDFNGDGILDNCVVRGMAGDSDKNLAHVYVYQTLNA